MSDKTDDAETLFRLREWLGVSTCLEDPILTRDITAAIALIESQARQIDLMSDATQVVKNLAEWLEEAKREGWLIAGSLQAATALIERQARKIVELDEVLDQRNAECSRNFKEITELTERAEAVHIEYEEMQVRIGHLVDTIALGLTRIAELEKHLKEKADE